MIAALENLNHDHLLKKGAESAANCATCCYSQPMPNSLVEHDDRDDDEDDNHIVPG